VIDSDLFVNCCNALVTTLMTIIIIIKVTYDFCVVGKQWPVTYTNAWNAFRYSGKGGSCCGFDARKPRGRSYVMIKVLRIWEIRSGWSSHSLNWIFKYWEVRKYLLWRHVGMFLDGLLGGLAK
jgi:hypothetical protein